MAQNYFFKDRTGAQNGPVSFEELLTIAKSGRITPDCLVWTEGGEPRAAGRVAGLADVFADSTMLAARTDKGPLIGDFPGWGLIWRFYVCAFGLASLVFAPLAGRWYSRFVASRVALPNGRRLFLEAPLSSCWWMFLGLALAFLAPALVAFAYLDAAHDLPANPQAIKALNYQLLPLRLAAQLTAVVLNYLILGWFVRSLRSEDGTLNVIFTGGFWAFVGWDLLIALSFVTIIGWAWAAKGKMSWMCRRTEGSYAVEFVASGWQILWRTFVAFLGVALLFGFTIGLGATLDNTGSHGAGGVLVLLGLIVGFMALAIALRWLANWWVSQIVATPVASAAQRQERALA